MDHRSAEAVLPAADDLAPRSTDILALEGKKDLRRVEGYDTARGLAIIGMVLVNFHAILFTDRSYPWWIETTANLIYGRAASLFVMLAGVGIILMSRRALLSGDPAAIRTVRFRLLRRSLFLLLSGLLFRQWWQADILHFYGLFLSTGACLLSWPVRRLCGSALTLLAVAAVFYSLSEGYPSLGDWLGRPNMFTETVDEMILVGQYPFLPWMAFLLTGMCLGKLEVHARTGMFGRVLIWGLALSISIELAASFLTDNPDILRNLDSSGPLFLLLQSEAYPITPLFVLSATAGSIAALVFACWLAGRPGFRKIVLPLKCAGQLSLTIYIVHVLFGKGLVRLLHVCVGREQYPAVGAACTVVFCLAVMLLSIYWCRHFGRGPLEWLLRRLSYTR